MAKRRQFKVVPKFSDFNLLVAELCAIDLWNGINFENGKKREISDEELLSDFASKFYKLVKNSSSKNLIAEVLIRRLIRAAKIKALFRSKNPLDFKRGIRCIAKNTVKFYKNRSQTTNFETQAILELGEHFVKPIKNPTRNGNFRVALASRILFFAIPNMQFFNFSNILAEKMLFQKRPQASIYFFNESLKKGLKKNIGLNKMKLPPPSFMKPALYKKIYKTKWWQRRVLDLALLLYFKVFNARNELKKKASQILLRKTKK